MKKLLSLFTVVSLSILFAGCASTEDAEKAKNADQKSPAPAAKADAKKTDKKAEKKQFEIPAPAKEDHASTTNQAVKMPAADAPRKVNYRKSKPIRYVIITSNYPTARFLADEARDRMDCTVIIVPEELPFPERGTLLTVIPADAEDAFGIRAEHLSRFLAYLRPQNVIMLGNDKILPPFYRPAIPASCNVINVIDNAWHVNAQTLDNIFNTKQKFYDLYSRYNYANKMQREQLNEAARRRAAAKAAADVRAKQQSGVYER